MSIVNTIGYRKLTYLKRNYDDLARKGSKSWNTGRKTRFGGSEMGKLLDGNIKKIIKNKKLLMKDLTIECAWGHMFEGIGKEWLKFNKNIEIYEFDAIPSSRLPISYSPDGVFINNSYPTKELADNDLWLLEIKCPIKRNITKDTQIMKYYFDQVQAGMSVLPCDKTLFVQFKFRKCHKGQLNKKGRYDRWFHREFINDAPTTDELWYGAIYWKPNYKHKEEEVISNNKYYPKYLKEEIRTDKPTEIFYSFKHNIFEEINKREKGKIMYFKCFYVKEDLISRDICFDFINCNIIWISYGELMEDYYKTKELIQNKCKKHIYNSKQYCINCSKRKTPSELEIYHNKLIKH